MAHCNQTDCIGCFGVECQSVMNGQCYTLSGTYCGDCHNCFDEDITTNNRNNRNQGGHVHEMQHAARHTHPIDPQNPTGARTGHGQWMNLSSQGMPETSLAGGHTHRRGLGNTIGRNGNTNGNQTNLRTRQGEFVNRRTGNSVPAGTPYHTHNGQAMAGARHVSTPHDNYDRVQPDSGRRLSPGQRDCNPGEVELWGVCYDPATTTHIHRMQEGLVGPIPQDIQFLYNLYI